MLILFTLWIEKVITDKRKSKLRQFLLNEEAEEHEASFVNVNIFIHR